MKMAHLISNTQWRIGATPTGDWLVGTAFKVAGKDDAPVRRANKAAELYDRA